MQSYQNIFYCGARQYRITVCTPCWTLWLQIKVIINPPWAVFWWVMLLKYLIPRHYWRFRIMQNLEINICLSLCEWRSLVLRTGDGGLLEYRLHLMAWFPPVSFIASNSRSLVNNDACLCSQSPWDLLHQDPSNHDPPIMLSSQKVRTKNLQSHLLRL